MLQRVVMAERSGKGEVTNGIKQTTPLQKWFLFLLEAELCGGVLLDSLVSMSSPFIEIVDSLFGTGGQNPRV